jgi:hypothetical protein
MFAMSYELDVIRVYTTAVETGVVQLPPVTSIGARRRRNGSMHRFPRDPVCVIRPAAAFNADGRIPALAGMTALPLPATGDYVDDKLALHTLQGRRRATFDWHDVFPQTDQEAGKVRRVGRARRWDVGSRTQEREPGLFFAVL